MFESMQNTPGLWNVTVPHGLQARSDSARYPTVGSRAYLDYSNTCKVLPCSHYALHSAVPHTAVRTKWTSWIVQTIAYSLLQVCNSPCGAVWFHTFPVYLNGSGHLCMLSLCTYVSLSICPQGCAVLYSAAQYHADISYVLRTCTVPCAVWMGLAFTLHTAPYVNVRRRCNRACWFLRQCSHTLCHCT